MARAAVHSYVIRDTWLAVVFWIAVAASAYLLGDPIVRGEWGVFAATAGIVLFVLWVLWLVIYHPHVRSTEEGVTVTNIGIVYVLPWPRVVAIRQHLNVDFLLDDGRTIRAIGVTARRGRGLLLSGLTKGRAGAGEDRFHESADDLERLRGQAPASDAPVAVHRDTLAIVFGAAVTLLFAVDLAVLLIR